MVTLDNPIILDAAFLKNRIELSGAMLPQVIEAFRLEVPKLLEEIDRQYRGGQTADVQRLGHKLKGMCLNLGAARLAEIGRKFEEGSVAGFEDLLRNATDVFGRTLSQLLQLREQDPAAD